MKPYGFMALVWETIKVAWDGHYFNGRAGLHTGLVWLVTLSAFVFQLPPLYFIALGIHVYVWYDSYVQASRILVTKASIPQAQRAILRDILKNS